MSNSINTNIAAFYAQANITLASQAASSNVARLSSGNRIVQASDDVAALAAGTSLATQVSALKTAQVNASQGNSLLQVADGALAQILNILQRQKSIALQAGSGSLTDTDRGFLNQEFQALANQINSLTNSTTFNGVGLLDGSLSQTVDVTSNTTNADQAKLSLNFTTVAANATIIINGATLTAKAAPGGAGQFQVGGSIAQTVDNLVAYLNGLNNDNSANATTAANKLLLTGAVYSRQGNSLVVTARPGGSLADYYLHLDSAAAGTATYTINGQGAESIGATNAIAIGNVDSDATSVATSKFGAGALTLDGATIATVVAGDSLRTIVNKINALTNTTGASAYVTGSTGAYVLNVRIANSAAAGVLAGAAITGATGITDDGATIQHTVSFLNGGGSTGLKEGSTIGQGTTGGATSVLTDQTQNFATSTISFPDISSGNLNSTANFGTARTITIAGVVFTFTSTASASTASNEIAIGDTLQHTLDNAVAQINSYFGQSTQNFQFGQLSANRDGNNIIISSRKAGDVVDEANAGTTVAASLMTGGSVSAANLKTTSNTGIDTVGVMNAGFVGTIGGFTSTYVSSNTVNLAVTVGGIQYSASNVTTNPTANSTVRMESDTGGYFDMILRANQGSAVANQSDADAYANRVNAAVSGVTFSQNRDVSSYTASGTLLGSSVKFQTTDFSNVQVDNLTVTAPSGSNPNGAITFTINGETYTTLTPIGDELGANSVTKFVSASDANKFLTFTNGSTALSFASAEDANTLQTQLRTAFGVGSGSGALKFQIGTTTADTVSVSIASAKTADIYKGQNLDVSTQAGAITAAAALGTAIDTVVAIRSGVGALESQFNYAAAALQTSVQNQDAARGQLLDTDIATESTVFATNQVKLQAGISVLAQANQQLQSLLKLIG